jgi:hypothetical protein
MVVRMRIRRLGALVFMGLIATVVLLSSGGNQPVAALAATHGANVPLNTLATARGSSLSARALAAAQGPHRLAATPAAATPAAAPPAAAPPLDRYSIVHGCYSLSTPSGPIAPSDAPFRMQASTLGQYLLYGVHDDYIDSTLAPVSTPSTSSIWAVTGDSRTGFTFTNLATGHAMPVTLTPGTGCAVYPEAQVDATGPAFTGPSPEAGVLGTVEGHAHVTAFELFGGDWHCGQPWSPYGAPFALPASCAADEQGTNGEVESFVDFGGATRPSGIHGWPTFVDWPSPTALAEEGDYYTGIERAWKAGLRVMVTNLVDNEALCSLMTKRTNPCNDMSSVLIQNRDLHALQNYIDAQSGGPGKGWFRLVTDPFQARQVINQGKLAVVEGIEVSRIFGCGENDGVPQCNQSQVDAGLQEVHNLGVRTFFPIHEFNNAFGGTKMIAGDLGLLINAGNREETGSFFNLQPCPAQDQDAEQVTPPGTGPLATLLNGPVSGLLHGSPLPVYGSGPQCNTQGLTSLGSYLIKEMIKDHFIIQLDHMDSKTADAALAIAQGEHYSGVVSAHCCSSPQLFQRIYSTGGFISEPVGQPQAFVNIERTDKSESDPKYAFGFGYGSDMNGLAEQPGPDPADAIHYPFKSYDGKVTFTPEVWGDRTFNLNTDGLANYGMYADWLQSVQQIGGSQIVGDMMHGAEAYLDMWERASGVPSEACRPARASLGPIGNPRLPMTGFQSVLFADGQPLARLGHAYQYCINGNRKAKLSAVFNSGGRVTMWATNARGYSAGGIEVGQRSRVLRASATRLAPGLWISPRLRGGNRFVYGVRGNRVTYVALAGRSIAHRRAGLHSALTSAGVI